MTPAEYLKESARTVSDQFHPSKVSFYLLEEAIEDIIDLGMNLDDMRKALFYGKDIPRLKSERVGEYDTDFPDVKALHAILGIVAEATEILDVVFNRWWDKKKVISEMGDLLWFMALLCRQMEVTLEEVMEFNITKLRKRFPDKFDAERAINKNTEAEDEAGAQAIA